MQLRHKLDKGAQAELEDYWRHYNAKLSDGTHHIPPSLQVMFLLTDCFLVALLGRLV